MAMSFGLVLLTSLLAVCYLGREVESNHGGPHYCPQQYTAYVQERYCVYRRWWWSRSCCYWRWRSIPVIRTNPRACCPGYKGSLCNIPICNSPTCKNNAVCVSPNTCYCRPGTSGSDCGKLAFCTAVNDCYPGTCNAISRSCSCSSGYSGSNCQNALSGGNFAHCNLYLDVTQAGAEKRHFIGKCSSEEDPYFYTYYSNIATTHNLVVDYEVQYPNNNDYPPLPSEYMSEAKTGLTRSYYTAQMFSPAGAPVNSIITQQCNINVAPGQSPPSASNPHQTLQCKNVTHSWSTIAGHNYYLDLRVYSDTGGFKRYITSSNVIQTRSYSGTTANQRVMVLFDLEAPSHCSTTNDCENPATDWPSTWLPDVTKDSNASVLWYGWNDTESGIENYQYAVHKMFLNPVSGKLVTDRQPVVEIEWMPDVDINYVTLPSPGMYSVTLTITDFAGNKAMTRSLALYHDSSPIEIQPDVPVTIPGAESWGNAFWFTQAGSDPITISWTNRFINRFIHDNSLLNEVEPLPNHVRDNIVDDNTGNRTVSTIPNVQGVTKFEVTFNVGTVGTIATTPTGVWVDMGIQQTYQYTQPRTSGQSVIIFLKAYDVFNETMMEKIPIHIDDTAPILNSKAFVKNTGSFDSSVNLNLVDTHSGIRMINYTVIDKTTATEEIVYTGSEAGQEHLQATTKEACLGAQTPCYCIPLGPCYNVTQTIPIDHCRIKDRLGHDFYVTFTAVNGAGLTTPSQEQLGILTDLKGIGAYPKLTNSRTIDANAYGTKATIAWTYQRACYNVTKIRLVFLDGESRRELEVAAGKQTYELLQLRPLSEYSVQLYVVYEGGHQSDGSIVNFKTGALRETELPPGGGGLDSATLVGIIFGIVILVLLAVIIGILLIRRRQHKPMVPDRVRNATTRIRNRLSRFHASGDPEADLKGANNDFADARYTNNEYSHAMRGEKKLNTRTTKSMALNVAYIGAADEDDDVYIYGTMETDPNAQWKVSNDRLVLQGPLPDAKGRFADLKLATLHDKNGQNTVVAKMNKAGASEEDKMLMTAKMNFLATDVPWNECIVNFLGAVPPPKGPVILMEYCKMGRLLDWLKNQTKMTADEEDLLISFSQQVANGMQHLHDNNILHRRLGCRNILLTTTHTNQVIAKISGFGPMKGEHMSTGQNAKKERVPLKWMAPEQFDVTAEDKRKYTPKTDVWSYGITLHEMFNKGEAPYEEVKSDFKDQVKNGYRMPRGDDCPEFMYEQVMLPCWADVADQRPSFDTLLQGMKHYYDGTGPQEGYYYDYKTNKYGGGAVYSNHTH